LAFVVPIAIGTHFNALLSVEHCESVLLFVSFSIVAKSANQFQNLTKEKECFNNADTSAVLSRIIERKSE
jgi:hypothetical protein